MVGNEINQSLNCYICRMVENGIKPVYVFDGKPPTMKVRMKNKKINPK